MEVLTFIALAARMLILTAVAPGDLGYRLSNKVHCAAFSNTTCLIVCFHRLDMLTHQLLVAHYKYYIVVFVEF